MMTWTIEFDPKAKRELKKFDPQVAKRISAYLEERLAPLDNPRLIGAPLQGSKFGEFWKYRTCNFRMGDYRIIARIEDEAVRILVVRVANRREVYR
jgi:mRNA interferase RelE/StbE